MRKLEHYGVRGVIKDWFSTYLLDRIQTTQIGSGISNKEQMLSGVPQGSVLGPLLFLIYINDMYKSSNKLTFYLFADDTNLLYADKNLKSLENIVNIELSKISNWLTANKLFQNIKKSNYVIFHPYQKKPNYQVDLKMLDTSTNTYAYLERKSCVRYLGVLIDSNLSWKDHINHIVAKISRLIGVIAKLRHFVPTQTLLNIYRSLIQPHMSYGIVVWGYAAQTHLDKLLKLQKRALRLIYFGQYLSHTIPFFCLSNILPINMLCFKATSILMHDVSNNITPQNISKQFIYSNIIHKHNTRSSLRDNYFIKFTKLQKQRNSFLGMGTRIWNILPTELRDLTKKDFGKTLHRELLDILLKKDDFINQMDLLKEMDKYLE